MLAKPMKSTWEMLSEIEALKETIEEQLLTIKALNACIGGEHSTSLENIRRTDLMCGEQTWIGRVEHLTRRLNGK